MWTVVEYVSFFIIVYWLVKHAWPSRPSPADQKREEDRKHDELIRAIASIKQPKALPVTTRPTVPLTRCVIVDTGTTEGTPYTRYSDGSIEVQFPEGHVRYYDDGSIETQTPAGPLRLRTAIEMLNFITQGDSASGQKIA